MKTFCKFILVSALLGMFSQSVAADDGDCDILTDATPGLFGLCTAYCEAQSCDSYAPGEEPRSCNRLLANYDRKKTDSDPDMPCLAAEASCPCWGLDELAAGGMGLGDALCTPNTGTGLAQAAYLDFSTFTDTIIFLADGDGAAGTSSCLYGNTLVDPLPVVFDTDEEQDAECRAGIDALQVDHTFCP